MLSSYQRYIIFADNKCNEMSLSFGNDYFESVEFVAGICDGNFNQVISVLKVAFINNR